MTETGNRGQSRLMSLVEAIANVLVGYGLAVLTQILVFPLFGLRTTLSENLAMGLVFTIVSLARSYVLVAPSRRSGQVGTGRHSRRPDVDQATWPETSA